MKFEGKLPGVFVAAAIIVSLDVGSAFADENESEVVDSGGGHVSNLSYHSEFSIGQGISLGTLSSGTNVSLGGFMQTFVLHPSLDNDGDGITDEIDLDDDNDDLSDGIELTGTAFDPNSVTDLFEADSDGDGEGDSEEALAGTNPLDAGSRFRVIAIDASGVNVRVEWTSRDQRTYQVWYTPDIFTPPILWDTVVASGGLAPWWETTSESVKAKPAGVQAYFFVTTEP